VVGGKLHGTNVDLNEVVEEVGSQSANLLGPGSRPHESLSVGSNLANDLADLGLETHVKHAISLVEDEVGNTTQVGLTSLEHVNQTTGGGNADLDSSRKIADLRTLGDTTVDTGVADARRSTELLHLFLDLDSKLTSGSEDKDNRAIAGGEKRLGVDVNDGGKAVCESLSGTSLGNTNDITTRESHGPTLGLNGGGSRETLGLDLIHNISWEASLIESLDRLGDLGASNGHLMLAAESLNVGIRSVLNIGVLLVEGLLELGQSADIPFLVLEARAESAHTVAASTSSVTTAAVTTTTTVAATAAAVAISIASASVTTTVTIAVTTTVAAAITAITTTAVATASAATTAVSAVVARHYDKE
jgi:hypothetical protein